MTKKFSIKKLVAGVLAAAMVVTALPVSGLSAKAAGADTEKVYRSYNPNSSEHFMTTDAAEHAMVVAQGRTDEGVAWIAPKASSTPIYRVYNAASGEHLLMSKREAEGLAANPASGWTNEGQKMYSDDNKGVGIYRLFNPNATDAGSHHYTANLDEVNMLVSLGWSWENNQQPIFYGVNEEITEELALESVEAATVNVNGANVVIAYFNRPVSDIAPADIQIRNAASDQLYSVEKVAMSSDKKSATITLAGTDAAGAGGSTLWLQPNTEYKMTVTNNGSKAEKTFTIPAIEANETVIRVDSAKKQITLRTGSVISIPDSIEVDYNEILGRDVTVKYDKDMVATSLTVASQKIVYGGFLGKVEGAEQYLLNPVNGEKYYLQQTTPDTGTIYTTGVIEKTSTGWSGLYYKTAIAGTEIWPYAKLCLNSNGTVKVAVIDAGVADTFLADKVSGENLVNGKSELNLKDYTILRDGKTIKVSDITAGEAVFVDVTNKFADVYTAKKEGALGNVYQDQFVFEGATYKFAGAKYVDGELKKVDADYMDALKAGGKNITVYFNRAAQPAFILGTKGEVKTSTTELVLTKAAQTYNESLEDVIRVTGYDTEAKEVKSYDVKVSKLKSITNQNGARLTIGSKVDDDKNELDGETPEKFAATADFDNNTDTITVTYDSGSKTKVVDTVKYNDKNTGADLNADMAIGEKIGLTMDENGAVIGIDYTAGAALAKLDNVAVGGGSGASTAMDKTFKAGYKVADGSQLVATTDVYLVDVAKGTVKTAKYGDFTGEVKKTTNAKDIQVYASKGVVSAVVVAVGTGYATVDGASDDGDVFRGVVSRYNKNTAGDKSAYLEVVVGTETKKFEKFADAAVGNFKTGEVVDITPNKAGTMINKIASAGDAKGSGAYKLDSDQNKTFTIGGKVLYGVAANTTCTIAKETTDAQGNTIAVPMSFAELNGTDKIVNVWTIAGSDNAVDAIVVTTTNATKPVVSSSNFKFTSDAGKVINGATAGNLIASSDSTTLTVTVSNLGENVGISKYEWYYMAGGVGTAELITGETTKKLTLANVTTNIGGTHAEDDAFCVVVTDTNDVKHKSETIILKDPTLKTITYAKAASAVASDGSTSQGTITGKDQFGHNMSTPVAGLVVSPVTMEEADDTANTGNHTIKVSVDNSGKVTLAGTAGSTDFVAGDNLKATITIAEIDYTVTATCAAPGTQATATWEVTVEKE